MAQNSRGKGWFGDAAGHAKAGRKGGLARSRKANIDNKNKSNRENYNNR